MASCSLGEKSRELYERALKLFSGGVNSPVRAAVKPYPFFVERGEGAYLYTVDGCQLVDFVLGYGPLILGHRHPAVLKALQDQLEKDWLYGALYELEVMLAERILRHVMPGGKIRFVNTGTEATMTAIRLARGYTGRKYIVKFDGCYHGAHDYVLVSTGSAATEYGVPNSLGVPVEAASLTLIAEYNNEHSVDRIMEKYGDSVAAIIVEPVIGNMGVIPPKKGFLEFLEKAAREHGSLLILDEVITGFRLSLGGAQEYYNVKGDIITLGKIIGGGMPVGAVVARSEIMDMLTPRGKVFNAGTFNAHPATMAAGLATIRVLEETSALSDASRAAEEIEKTLRDNLEDAKIDFWINRVESMLQVFFTENPVEKPSDARKSNRELYAKLHAELLKRGVFIAPSQFEAIFTSAVHKGEPVERTISALGEAITNLKQ